MENNIKDTIRILEQKDLLDRFYTPVDTAKYCISQLNLSEYDNILEPSAGSGNFSNQIPNCIALDIEPAAPGIKKQDFFKYKPNFSGKTLTIGNPPFGTRASLAIRFFNHAAEFSDTIAFVIPKSFRKESVQRRLNPNFWLESDIDVDDIFLYKGRKYRVPCCFQIWKRKEQSRKIDSEPISTDKIKFVGREDADFRVQRIGRQAGKASFNLDYSDQSNYFIMNNTGIPDYELVDLINSIKFDIVNNTAGPKSLSKNELLKALRSKGVI